MKDSTKEYLKAGGLAALALAGKLISPGARIGGTIVKDTWDSAQKTRAEEARAAEIPIGTEFLLPDKCCMDEDGKYIPGGRWKVAAINGRWITLEHPGGFSRRCLLSYIEKTLADAIPVGTMFLLPDKHFRDEYGEYIPGGKWKKTSINRFDGSIIELEHCSGLSRDFRWSDIKEYRQK